MTMGGRLPTRAALSAGIERAVSDITRQSAQWRGTTLKLQTG
jgi:hypothetical protein